MNSVYYTYAFQKLNKMIFNGPVYRLVSFLHSSCSYIILVVTFWETWQLRIYVPAWIMAYCFG